MALGYAAAKGSAGACYGLGTCYSPPLPSNVVPAGSGGSNYVSETDIERVSDQEGHFRARFPRAD
jgi:hypothetical protein